MSVSNTDEMDEESRSLKSRAQNTAKQPKEKSPKVNSRKKKGRTAQRDKWSLPTPQA